jgi:hypothetical protein
MYVREVIGKNYKRRSDTVDVVALSTLYCTVES